MKHPKKEVWFCPAEHRWLSDCRGCEMCPEIIPIENSPVDKHRWFPEWLGFEWLILLALIILLAFAHYLSKIN